MQDGSTTKNSSLDRRRTQRLPAAGTGLLEWNDATGPRGTTVRVTNVSADGVTIELPEAVKAPQMGRLTGNTWQCLGWLRYCNEQRGGFMAGFEFVQDPYPKGSFDPHD